MDLDVYEEWTWQEMRWIRKQLENEGIAALRASYEQLGEPALRAFLAQRKSEIDALLQTPPGRRGPMIRAAKDEKERHALLICTAYTVRCAAHMMDLATRYGFSASYNPSKASLMLIAARIVLEIDQSEQGLWPFDD